MSKVINPSDSDLAIVYRGVSYKVAAGGVLENVPAEAAEYWKQSLHNFIVLADDDAVAVAAPAPVVEEVVDAVEAPVEAVAEEEVAPEEEAPAPKKSKK